MADQTIKILLADDSAFMRKVLMDILKEAGYNNFVESEDGESCIAMFNSEKPGLIILDIIMPKKSGITVLKEIGPKGANIIIVSIVGQEQMIMDAKKNGAKDFLTKPFTKEDVIATVNKVVADI